MWKHSLLAFLVFLVYDFILLREGFLSCFIFFFLFFFCPALSSWSVAATHHPDLAMFLFVPRQHHAHRLTTLELCVWWFFFLSVIFSSSLGG